MLCRPKMSEDELFTSVMTCKVKDSMFSIKFGDNDKPIFKLDGCTVKYTLGKFDKITLEHSYSGLIKKLNKCITTALGSEEELYSPVSKTEIGLKITKLTKDKAQSLSKYDTVDVIIEFNNCWKLNDKIYTSFILKDFVLTKNGEKEEETPFTFGDL